MGFPPADRGLPANRQPSDVMSFTAGSPYSSVGRDVRVSPWPLRGPLLRGNLALGLLVVPEGLAAPAKFTGLLS